MDTLLRNLTTFVGVNVQIITFVDMIRYFDRFPDVKTMKGVSLLEDTIAVFRYSDLRVGGKVRTELRNPHKFNFFFIAYKLSGEACMKVDMVDYQMQRDKNYMMRIAPGRIVSMEEVSEDFDCYVLLMSNSFIESLLVYMGQDISINGVMIDAVKEHEDKEKRTMEYIITAVRNIIDDDSNPFRRKVLEHLLMVVFYGSQQARSVMMEDKKPRSSAEVLTMKFLQEVKEHFRQERQLNFYSERLCITPRYLSRVVKETTGSSAAEWIERYVVLEARALLKSTNMTIQQVSDVLNFPSQTFFGKYFKRRVGISPKEYRREG